MSRPKQPRLPVDDLKAFVRPTDHGDLARRIHQTRRTLLKWIADGGIPLNTADEVAVVLGAHPNDIWGDAWHDVTIRYSAAFQNAAYDRSARGRDRQAILHDRPNYTWKANERAHRQWVNQQQRNYYGALDRAADEGETP